MASSNKTQEVGWSANEIIQNLGYLSENITSLNVILIRLMERRIISEDEEEQILSEKTKLSRNHSLLLLVQKKNWPEIKTEFLEILSITGNGHCVEKIEQTPSKVFNHRQSYKFDYKWWPEEKFLPKAFHLRKSENVLLTKKLKEMLSKEFQHDGVAVITQKVTVSGLGGIGKTTTAIWFAHEYKEEYTHIVWIDCGEGRLLNTFKKLAGDLQLLHTSEYELKDVALRCFKVLMGFKCLLIFDNAECYIGNEGVKDVLPVSYKNFDILITSRHQEWGNANGDGKIPQFLMNVFDHNEGVEFMQKNIENLSEEQKSQLEHLCHLLGNHPLALQIAVATLNRQKIVHLEKYIERIKNSPDVLHVQFDNYERTINATMKISLDLIQNYESTMEEEIGTVAYRIMTIFAFITPDEIPADFFLAVVTRQTKTIEAILGLFKTKNISASKISKSHIDAATDLLEKYSLLTRNNFVEDQYTLSVHRLLQQVIRYNEKDTKRKIIKQILNCEGFLEYKLIPFSYADQKLKNEFKTIRAELIDKLQLNQLLKEGRFSEAVELSKIIKSALKDQTSQFNFAVCLRHNLELKQSEKELESLLKTMKETEGHYTFTDYFSNWGIIQSSENLHVYFVRGLLLHNYIKSKSFAKASKAAIQWHQTTLPFLPLNDLITFINVASLHNVFIQLHKTRNWITFRVNKEKELPHSLELQSWVIDTSIPLNKDLHQLTLVNCYILCSTIGVLAAKNITLIYSEFGTKAIEPECPANNKFSMTKYFDFNKVEKLLVRRMKIYFHEKEVTPKLNLISQSMQTLEWEKEKWIISKFLAHYIDPVKDNQTTLTQIVIENSSVDISILPWSLRKFIVKNCCLHLSSDSSGQYNFLPSRLKQLIWVKNFVTWKQGTLCTPCDISYLISPTLKTLQVKNFTRKCSYLSISLSCLTSIKSLDLSDCAVTFVPHIDISPTELTLKNVTIINENNEIMSDVTVNQFVVFNKIKHLHLNGMSINFSDPVELSELSLINTKVMNWKNGKWVLDIVHMFPDCGFTRMKIDQLKVINEPENEESNSAGEMKKQKLLHYLKSISGSKTITGLSSKHNTKDGIEKIEKIAEVLPGILTTSMTPSRINEWQSFIEDTISDWRHCYLVHIILHPHRLDELIKDHSEISWIDLIEEGGKLSKLWKKELDTIAFILHQLEVAGVVPIVSLLPYINSFIEYVNELNDCKGLRGLNASMKLFQITKDYLTHHHGLSSLIWNWSLSVVGDMIRLEEYFPGNSYVDVVTVDMGYRKKLSSTEYQALLDVVGDKPIAMDWMSSVPPTKLLTTQSRWIWFTVHDDFIINDKYNSEHNTKNTFNSPSVINWDNNHILENIFCT